MVSAEEPPEEELRTSQTTPLESLSERLTFPEVEAQVTGLSELYNTAADSKLLFSDIRHGLKLFVEDIDPSESGLVSKWRQKDRLKTTAVALVVCLNIGVDPPDVIKISPCARMECWMDPLSVQAPKALETIGKNLQAQYERWQPRAKYKMELDPTTEDVKKVVSSCRRSAKNERVLFHYNGHGVPRPTSNGEIWVFNKSYTQYIPLSIYDLHSWIGNPAIYIFDCSIAGQILSSFKQFFSHSRDKRDNGSEKGAGRNFQDPMQDMILMCACSENELLPQDPSFPADIFTSCLTTPIKIALHWFCSKSLLGSEGITKEVVDRIPGKQTDRKTPLGELNWIFTAITDTIAWNALPRNLFQKLFRQDLLVASLFRNFLLAQRIMRSVGCTPVSHPRLPAMDQHPMWLAWDMAAETCLLQLPDILDDPQKDYVPSPFFSEQLTAFELWLDHGSGEKAPPEQLPIVLQVLLSQVHRLRALVLLGRFIDMGSWAVDLALSVGIFPYILKLLQTSATDLRQTLVFIWAKIVSWDMNTQVQNDLTKDGGYMYFVKHLESDDSDIVPESRAQAAFVLSAICKRNRKGQLLCAQAGLLQICRVLIPGTATEMGDPSAIGSDRTQQLEMLLKWLIICAGQVCEDVPETIGLAMDCQLQDSFLDLLDSDYPNIRAASVYAIGDLFTPQSDSDGLIKDLTEFERTAIFKLLNRIYDASPLVRMETIRALYRVSSSKFSSASKYISTIMSQQRDQGFSKSAPTRGQLSSYKSDVDFLNVSSSQDLQSRSEATDLNSLADEQDKETLVRLLIDGFFILSRDPSWDVRTRAFGVLVNLGFEVSGNNVSSCKGTSSEISAPTLIKPNVSAGMSSFLPKSWQAKSWRSFSSPAIKQLPSEQMSRLSVDNESPITNQQSLDELSSSNLRESVTSAINHVGLQHIKWPLLSPLAEEEPGISWLKSCPPNKLKLREQMKASGIAKCRTYTKVRLKEQVHAINTNGEAVEAIFIEPFKTQLVAADARGKIRVFDYLQSKLVNEFDSNRELATPSSIVTMYRLNDLYNELLLSCSRNGTVVAWRYYNRPGCELPATAWQAIKSEGTDHHSAVYSFSEQHLGGSLFAAGYRSTAHKSIINVWDLNREYCVDEITSRSKLIKNYRQIEASKFGSLLYTLSDEGNVELYDLRSHSLVSKQNIGKDAVGMIPELSGSEGYLISGHLSGRINFFDNRMNTPSSCLTLDKNIDGHSKGTMTVIHPHRNAPIFATATSSQVVKVWSAKGDQLGVVRAHASILGQPIGPTKCLAFSPISLKLASGAEDNVCAVYSLEKIN